MSAIGIDIGGTFIKAGLVEQDGTLRFQTKVPTRQTEKELIADLFALLDTLKAAASAKEALSGVGIAWPGYVDAAARTLVYAPNLQCHDVAVGDAIADRYGWQTFVGNDADCAALGESLFGGGCGAANNTILLTLGTGVGGGWVQNGKIYTGAHGRGIEPGHMVIVADGEPCGCGRKGCLECYASARNLPDDFAAKISAGDPAAEKALSVYLDYLAIGVANLFNLYQPEVLLIGGGISCLGDCLLLPLKERVAKQAYHGEFNHDALRLATLGNAAGVIGAAALAF